MQINTNLNSIYRLNPNNHKSNTVAFGNEQSDPIVKSLTRAADHLSKENSKIINPIVKAQKDGKFIEWLGRCLKKFGNSSAFNYIAHLKGKNTVSYVIATGNALKEAVGTVIYTTQALTNENLPPDKRKFVGMYDLGVGVVSTGLSFLFGIGVVPFQDKLAAKFVNNKLVNAPGFKVATAGIAFMIPTVLQQILIKRIVAPAVATPIAGGLKLKMEAKEAAKSQKNNSAELSPLTSSLILSQNALNIGTGNYLDAYKQKKY